jgi:hypothetical protein
MPSIQELINKLQPPQGTRYAKFLPALLAVLLLGVVYALRDYTNFSTQEAMDSAQLGRNLAAGRGYTTRFIRPFSLFLIQHAHSSQTEAKPNQAQDPARLLTEHPDISNPPVYPVILAGLMKVLPFDFTASATSRFWSSGGRFWRYQPDFLIAVFDELLFVALVILAFVWARRMFDATVAWTAAAVLLGSDLLWRFSVSGLSTTLLALIFMGVVWCLTRIEAEARMPDAKPSTLLLLAAAVGLLLGLGGLTRYAFLWLFIPTLIFVALFAGPRRTLVCYVAAAAFAAVTVPWIVRNWAVCGAPFGTATYHVLEGTELFPKNHLESSLAPSPEFFTSVIWAKLFANLRSVVQSLPTNLGGWISGFFLVGLLLPFRKPVLRHMRFFLLACVGLLIFVQALDVSYLSKDSPQVNSENLLVLLMPLAVIFGVSLFYTLLDQLGLASQGARLSVSVAFVAFTSLPLLFSLCSPVIPVVYPPYHPLLIQQSAAWIKPNELIMSDIPWAVAWYGDRQCVGLTLNAVANPGDPAAHEDFFAIHRSIKPIQALYLTQKTTDARFVSDWIRPGADTWGAFIVDVILRHEVPTGFPLRQMPNGYLPEQVFLAAEPRWR